MEPEDGDGKVQITLTEESGDVLSRVQGMKQWRVGPTMVRGSNKLLDDLPKAETLPPKKRKQKDVEEKSKVKEPKGKSKTKKNNDDVVDLDLGPDKLSRTNKGRSTTIRFMMEEILRLDETAFSSIPLFHKEGACRMKFTGAEHMTRERLLAGASDAFDAMCLVG